MNRTIDISTANGLRNIQIMHFPALDGWEIQHRFLSFAASQDKNFRREYIMEVLSYAAVEIPGSEPMRCVTAAIVENHLQTWQNIELVFEEILRHNGVDPKTHADKPKFWSDAGAEMATSFLAAVTELMSPALKGLVEQSKP